MLVGDFEEGWKEHEWRWKTKQQRPTVRHFPQPLWLGEESLVGKTILLYGEQGLGNSIQFCRYAKLVAELGARVILEVQKPLVQLFSTLAGVTELIEMGNPLPAFDYQCPLMSLPLAFRTTPTTIPNEVPYIYCEQEKIRTLETKAGRLAQTKSGARLGWRIPSELRPHVWRVSERKNVPFANIANLRDANVEFYSLQKGAHAQAELTELTNKKWEGPRI